MQGWDNEFEYPGLWIHRRNQKSRWLFWLLEIRRTYFKIYFIWILLVRDQIIRINKNCQCVLCLSYLITFIFQIDNATVCVFSNANDFVLLVLVCEPQSSTCRYHFPIFSVFNSSLALSSSSFKMDWCLNSKSSYHFRNT